MPCFLMTESKARTVPDLRLGENPVVFFQSFSIKRNIGFEINQDDFVSIMK